MKCKICLKNMVEDCELDRFILICTPCVKKELKKS